MTRLDLNPRARTSDGAAWLDVADTARAAAAVARWPG